MKLLNPRIGESSAISERSARRLIERGKAKLAPGGVVLIDTDPVMMPSLRGARESKAHFVRPPAPVYAIHDAAPGRAVCPPPVGWDMRTDTVSA